MEGSEKPPPDEGPARREGLTRPSEQEGSDLSLQEIVKRENKIPEGKTCVYRPPFGLKSLERKTSRQGGRMVIAFPEVAAEPCIVQFGAGGGGAQPSLNNSKHLLPS